MPPTPGALRHGAVSRSIARPGSRAISCSNLCATPKNVRVCRRQGPHSPRQLHCCASAPAESSANALTLAAAERDIPRVSVVRGTAKVRAWSTVFLGQHMFLYHIFSIHDSHCRFLRQEVQSYMKNLLVASKDAAQRSLTLLL